MMAIGRALPSAVSAPALSRAPIAAISPAGISRAAFTDTSPSPPTSSPCFKNPKAIQDGIAQVLTNDHPKGSALNSWKWDYPVGAGDYAALYPKAWFDYRWEKFPAHVYVEQFSPVLPDNYKETSYPIAVYRWHAENPTKRRVTVSVLLSWENMLGWLRSNGHDFSGAINAGNFNRSASESLGADGAMKGIVFDRNHIGEVKEAWDGQLAIAALESPGVEVSFQTTFDPNGDGKDVWTPFSKDGKLSNSADHWTSSDEPLAGAIAVRFTLEPGEKRVIPMVISWDLPVVEFGAGRKWHSATPTFTAHPA